MSEMFERVAAALVPVLLAAVEKGLGVRGVAPDLARAAIEAMREPTEAMVEDANLYTGDNSESYHIDPPLRAATYTAMIDAALK